MPRRAGWVLGLLTGLNLINYLDRLLLSAVLPKLQAELSLSNFEGGVLATVFLLGYFVTSPIFGALGDRLPRKHLIALGVAVWSLATIGSGLATGLGSLLLARALVGVGEASYATLAPTVIDDITPPERKGRALAIFYVATPIGGALGYILGGFIESRWGWRSAFFVAGTPGLILALGTLLMAEPERTLAKERADMRRDIGTLARLSLYRKAVLGYSAFTAAIGAFSYWAPTFLFVRHKLPLAVANFKFGLITVVAGALGTFLGGAWADRATRLKETTDATQASEKKVLSLLRICATGSAFGAPFAAAAFLSPSPTAFFALVFLAITFLFMNTSPINAIVLQSVPTELRASAMALSIFAIHAFGDLWSPPMVGWLTDRLPAHIAMLTLPVTIALSAIVWWPGRRTEMVQGSQANR
jgi:MFS family permease